MKTAAVLLTGLVLYALAGFGLAPYLIGRSIDELPIPSGHRISVDEVSFNPFFFDLTIRGPALTTADAILEMSANEIRADIRITSLTRRAWIFSNMTIDTPYVAVRGDGPDNPLRLLGNFLTWAFAPAADARAPRVDHLAVHGGQLHITPATPEAAHATIQVLDIELDVHNLSAEPATPAEFSLTASLNKKSGISSIGKISLFPATLDASLKIPTIDAAILLSYLDGQPDLDTVSGRTAVDGKVTYRQGIAQFQGTLQSTKIAVTQTAGASPVFGADLMLATQVIITNTVPRMTIGGLHLENPHLAVERNTDGALSGPPWLVWAARESGLGAQVRQIDVTGGSLAFSEPRTSPPVQILVTELSASMARTAAAIDVSIDGRINESGQGQLAASIRPNDGGFETADLRLSGVELSAVSPWFEQIFERRITSGDLTLKTRYESTGSVFEADNHVVIDDLVLAEAGADAPVPGLDLAVALLENERGRVEFTLPLAGERALTQGLLGIALRDLVDRLVQAPLTVLSTTIDAEPSLDRIGFVAGHTAFTPDGDHTLEILARALHTRPRLGVTVIPRYHPVADRDALARQQMMLHIALATSAGPPGSAARNTLVLSDPKVISILDEFANARLRANVLAAIGARFATRDDAYYDAVLQTLIDNEKVSGGALERVARFRARAVVDALTASGVEAERLVVAQVIETLEPTEQITSRMQVFALPRGQSPSRRWCGLPR